MGWRKQYIPDGPTPMQPEGFTKNSTSQWSCEPMKTNSLSIQPRTRKESPDTISVGPLSSDTQIVDHFQRGDSTVFHFLYLRYHQLSG